MFKQRRVPAKARRKTYAWSGDGVGVGHDEDEPEERHINAGVGFDGWRYEPEPEAAREEPPARRLALIRNGRRGVGLPEELVERCLAFVTPRDRLNIFGAASRVATRAAREPRWFLPRASRLARKLNAQLRAQMALVNEQMTVVSDAQARVRHLKTCLGSVERKLDDRRREFRAHREKPLAAAVRRRALFSKRGARELVDVARAAVEQDVDIAQPFDAYYDGVVKKDIRALEYSVAACDHRWKEAQRAERADMELLRGLRRRAKELNTGCKVATRIVAVTEERRDRRPPPLLPGGSGA